VQCRRKKRKRQTQDYKTRQPSIELHLPTLFVMKLIDSGEIWMSTLLMDEYAEGVR